MYRILVTLSCFIFVVGTNGVSLNLPTSINENVIELARLMEQYSSLKPAAIQNHRPLAICQFIDNCCRAEDRSKAISLMVSSSPRKHNFTFPKVINTCTDSTALSKADQSCPSLQQFSSLPLVPDTDDPALRQFYNLRKKYNIERIQISKLMRHMRIICNNYEFYAFVCLSDKKSLQSCVGKVIQRIHDYGGYEAYYKYMIEIKQSLTNLNQQLVQLFVENRNTD
ncbi:unnamed protein product [Didymodactylos carnosus]|uniref:Uncharacterized protein n=1 Tax=Didymodactylos carnosus TaxID=1234261 RepID=A0A814CI12_9BILA|nr:unnamed protein product [Didymodactylos carnosus]CAF1075455.1 unnamed protein product [Didymodactylos carnosus]CAF3718250.1 unnamed protein product [Didymodactylos carnosus]CAF3839339.1 unnamed protein product [Didymodactylos carnosus]